jgi:hypothetical protein
LGAGGGALTTMDLRLGAGFGLGFFDGLELWLGETERESEADTDGELSSSIEGEGCTCAVVAAGFEPGVPAKP